MYLTITYEGIPFDEIHHKTVLEKLSPVVEKIKVKLSVFEPFILETDGKITLELLGETTAERYTFENIPEYLELEILKYLGEI